MDAGNHVFIVNQQALIEAALEMEKQDTLFALMLLQCIDQLEDIHRKLETIVSDGYGKARQARGAFLNLFMNDKAWGQIISDERITQWKAEFEENGGLKS